MDWRNEYEEETGFAAYEFGGVPKRGYVEWLEEELEQRLKAGQHETIVNRLGKLLPKLEDGKATHIEWRDCDQKWRDENPDIGSIEFHAECVEEYDERIGAIMAAIEALK